MYKGVKQWNQIRRSALIEGQSIHRVGPEAAISRTTIRKVPLH